MQSLLFRQSLVNKFRVEISSHYHHHGFREYINSKKEHSYETIKICKGLFYFVSCPLLVGYGVVAYKIEQEHKKHPRPEFINYNYLYGHRLKSLFWGDGKKSLFHNPATNALPDIGYEVPDPAVQKKDSAKQQKEPSEKKKEPTEKKKSSEIKEDSPEKRKTTKGA